MDENFTITNPDMSFTEELELITKDHDPEYYARYKDKFDKILAEEKEERDKRFKKNKEIIDKLAEAKGDNPKDHIKEALNLPPEAFENEVSEEEAKELAKTAPKEEYVKISF